MIRQSATLSNGFAPRDISTLFGPSPGSVAMWDQPPLTAVDFTSVHPQFGQDRGEDFAEDCGPAPRCFWSRASSSASGAASSRCVRTRELGHRGVEVPQELIRW